MVLEKGTSTTELKRCQGVWWSKQGSFQVFCSLFLDPESYTSFSIFFHINHDSSDIHYHSLKTWSSSLNSDSSTD
jgi:hypothetical protein